MAKILPFSALRYNLARVRLADVVTQPYDKITPEMQERYYSASPYNLVRIILGKYEPGDNGQNVYSRAAAAVRNDQSVLPEQRARLVESHIADALRSLKAAAKAGFFDQAQRDNAKTDTDLDILHDRPEFRRLIESTGAKP